MKQKKLATIAVTSLFFGYNSVIIMKYQDRFNLLVICETRHIVLIGFQNQHLTNGFNLLEIIT